MFTALGILAALAALAGAYYLGWQGGRISAARSETALGPDPFLLPDPAIEWLRRAHGALGVWLGEPAQFTDKGPRFQRALAPDPAGATVDAVERRLQLALQQGASGAERLEGATLLFGASSGYVAGLLVPGDADRDRLDSATEDLVRLLDGAARRPLLQKMVREQEQPKESAGSIGLRLAYQLERILDAEVLVAVLEKGAVKVVGASGRADRRLLDTYAAPGSPLYRVARGEEPGLTSIADPLGGVVEDRRARFAPSIVMPIKNGNETIGAIAFWSSEDAQPIQPVTAEVHEALNNAGPRFARALSHSDLDETSKTDPLTGLKNRRLVHAQIRTGDTAARIGGEEFALWLPGASLRIGERVAEALRLKLGTTAWEWQGQTWPLSASFGVAACPDTSKSKLNLAAQADTALYQAKASGRNRVTVATRLEQAS
jgi:GGDEF domain-containing protein